MLSLIEDWEVPRRAPGLFDALAREGIELERYPIVDFGVPRDAAQTTAERGTAGQAWVTVSRGRTVLWRFLAVRPAASSGRDGSGLELRYVDYRGRRVLHQAHVPILNVRYDRDACGPYRDWQWQEGTIQATGRNVAPGFRLCSAPAKTIMQSGSDTGNYLGVGEQTGQAVVTSGSYIPNTQFINLPANTSTLGGATAASFALSLFSASAQKFLNLELTALEADGKGKIISSPRVITADQIKALIEQGEELPYQVATSSGATLTAAISCSGLALVRSRTRCRPSASISGAILSAISPK